MAKAGEITVNIETTPTWETARRCLKILEWFINDNPVKIIAERVYTQNGYETRLHFEEDKD